MQNIFIILFIILFSCAPAYTFYCQSEPIGRWDSKEKVLKHCGKPLSTGHKTITHEGKRIYVETWTYNCGESDFIYEVSFYDNAVIKEEPNGRGSGSSQCKPN